MDKLLERNRGVIRKKTGKKEWWMTSNLWKLSKNRGRGKKVENKARSSSIWISLKFVRKDVWKGGRTARTWEAVVSGKKRTQPRQFVSNYFLMKPLPFFISVKYCGLFRIHLKLRSHQFLFQRDKLNLLSSADLSSATDFFSFAFETSFTLNSWFSN